MKHIRQFLLDFEKLASTANLALDVLILKILYI